MFCYDVIDVIKKVHVVLAYSAPILLFNCSILKFGFCTFLLYINITNGSNCNNCLSKIQKNNTICENLLLAI